MPNTPRIRIETDRSDGSICVTLVKRHGWTVLHRCKTEDEAHAWAQGYLRDQRDFAMEGR